MEERMSRVRPVMCSVALIHSQRVGCSRGGDHNVITTTLALRIGRVQILSCSCLPKDFSIFN